MKPLSRLSINEGFEFGVGDRRFVYDRLGLRLV